MSRVCRRILVKEGSPAAALDAPSNTLPALPVLTAREQAIARRAAAGKTNKEIAIELNVSPDTVKKHLGAVFDKVGVRRRSQLAYCLAVPGQRRPE
jgi:DNA-binding CsgD family transcriptional regulator